ncbi:oligoendopeptidase F [Bradymonas sediminis]|uniref:Oligopeptidase F n=1 Tax=Bradymonas sediminis TaxID=1548548 RepID=A0A2Z4FIM2_9DELT|nr:oligoendopeptidase F [Bradymonas sediminis]AWV88877.1 oligoendopeptidase F [Bradymonas sediminis]TDP71880.1 oligoendopeptidase F [Bradymonas sediminis]
MSEATQKSTANAVPERADIAERHKWNLGDIYPNWEAWDEDITRCRALMDKFVAMKGTLGDGAERMLEAYQLNDQIGMMAYKIFRYPQLSYDTDQRNNELLARIQNVQNLFAEFGTKAAWFEPELVSLDEDTVRGWVDAEDALKDYRFPIGEVFRQREHVLDEEGERLLSYFSRFNGNPGETYRALSTADVKFNTVELSDGSEVEVSHAAYSRLLRTCRNQEDRKKAFEAMYGIYQDKANTYASLYNGICQRGAASARARNFDSAVHAALDGNNVPVSVLETLVETAAAGVAPLQRYHALRKKVLGLEKYDQYDGSIPLVDFDLEYEYDAVAETIIASVAPLGEDYQRQIREALEGGWIDVYETKGKRSGAYSAGVYGVHPYMLLNYNGTLSDVFTLAHELGHTMHTLLANQTQPFATSDYTIFVAEVASTLNEALLLEYMLGQTEDPVERAVLLQHAIDGIVGTFYMQALFADYELRAHQLAEEDQPITAEVLNEVYYSRLKHYLGDVAELDPLYAATWARIPHFFNSPFYVYQYATCYASSAKLVREVLDEGQGQAEAVERYLNLLRAGGSDHPMELLKAAGVDLSEPSTVEAVVTQLDTLVGMLEKELDALAQAE